MKSQENFSRHLKIISGQIAGIEKMLAQKDLDCVQVLTQLKAVDGSFRSLSEKVAREMLQKCLSSPQKMREKDLQKFLEFAFKG
ncbi:metal-sensitive transcriptional regulator [Candidatus Gracilibacteria bacterium]|nr:metal-sensitive transcriptional regulator [Candidatus Gracilibacteria bacterium]MCF7819301.1 metal-sensitive transcriptional regulator [Candidatus Gracilibacteria bacterium]